MTLQLVNESEEDEEEEYQAQQRARQESHASDADEVLLPPVHPVASMQGAFEESIYESIEDATQPLGPDNAEARRQRLLEVRRYDDSWRTRWRQKSTARYHPLLKLMAQIIFGMHLLQQQQAKSNEEVVRILQTHVNEVDTFLEKTAEDFDLAIADIDERIRHLKLPMTHLDVFKVMLDDRPFRSQLMDGNAKIEKIVERSAKAMSAALADIGEGVQATNDLARYLKSTAEDWPLQKPDVTAVFNAMKGNEQGWIKYLRNLQARGQTLGRGLALLSSVINEMSKLATAATARSRTGSATSQRTQPGSPGLHSKFSREAHTRTSSQLDKPLPVAPATANRSGQMSPKQPSVSSAQRYERSQAPTPNFSTVRRSKEDDVSVRPKTAGNEPNVSRSGSISSRPELEKYLSTGGPLRSHPPDRLVHVEPKTEPLPRTTSTKPPSQAATEYLNAQSISRPKSQMATLLMGRGDGDASRPSSRGGPDRAMSVKSAPTTRKGSTSGKSFARRFSKRFELPQRASGESSRPATTLGTTPELTEPGDSTSLFGAANKDRRTGPLGFLSKTVTTPINKWTSTGSIRRNTEANIRTSSPSQNDTPPFRAASVRSRATTRSVSLRHIFNWRPKNDDVLVE